MPNSEQFNQYNEKTGTKDFLLGAFIGGVVGACTALWFSSKSGTAFCETVNNKTESLKEKTGSLPIKVSELAEMTKEKTSSLTQSLARHSNEAISKIKGKKEEHPEEELYFNPIELTDSETGTESFNKNSGSIQKMLEETKKAFDETEQKLNY